jgi:hypothetical protein
MACESAYAQLIQDVTLVELLHVSSGVYAIKTEKIADIMLEYLALHFGEKAPRAVPANSCMLASQQLGSRCA